MKRERGIPIAVLGILCAVLLAACAQSPLRRAEAPAAAPPPAKPAQQAEAETPAEYPLGAGDVVRITVYNSPDLTTEAEVSQNGTLNFPLIGEIKVGGLSRAEAEKAIATALSKGGFVRNAHVNMLVLQYRGRQVSVLGEVNRPGKYPLNQVTNLTDAIAMAGGITQRGGYMVTVIRKTDSGTTEQYAINFKKLLAGGDPERNIRIASDDVIYVAPAPVFYIYGEVRQPGAYPLTPDMTVRQALSVGGGLTPRGSERGIEIDRKSENGQVSTRRARLTDRVQPDDVLQVPESWF